MRWSLFLDDIRNPKGPSPTNGWIVARSFAEALTAIHTLGPPVFISFDHDLGEDVPTGMDLAKWLVDQELDGNLSLPRGFTFNVHSANPVGAKNIEGLLNGYLKTKS